MNTIFTQFVPLVLPLLGAEPQAPPAIPQGLVREVVEERSLEAIWQVGLPLDASRSGWQAPNRAHGMRTVFTAEGPLVLPREHAEWSLALSLRALERGAAREAVAPALLEVRGARAEYRREGLLEWYSNERGGLHQAFELDARPLVEGHGSLRLVLEVGGAFEARAAGADGARFVAEDGGTVLAWSGLKAWDTNGTALEVCVSIETGNLVIEVADLEAAYPITIDPVITTELQKVVASDATQGATLGEAIAIDGDTFVVGAIRDASLGAFTGAAYVFVWNGSTWVQQAKLVGSDSGPGDTFGQKLEVSGDTIIVGSDADGAIGQLAGQVYIFQRTAGVWAEQAILQALDGQNGDTFGRAVSIDGNTAAIGARNVDDSLPGMGAVYIWTRSGTTWNQQVKLYAGDPQQGALFGHSVSVHAGTLVVGAYLTTQSLGFEGSAYVFTGAGSSWTQQQKLVAGDPAIGDQFGWDVSNHGDFVVVGARFQDPMGTNSGAAYVFERSGGAWPQVQKLVASDGAALDRFGHDVDIEGDSVVVGVPEHDALAANAGAAYLFQRVGGQWVEVVKFQASNGAGGHNLGTSVATSNNWTVAGAPGEGSAAPTAGAAYIFQNAAGVPYCFGSGGLCPCGNGSISGEGCANSTGLGGRIITAGSSSFAGNNLTVNGSQLKPGQPALLFSANNAVNGGLGVAFGDGLRCAGGAIRRLGVKSPNAGGGAVWGPGLNTAGAWSAGDIRRLQVWYRDPIGSPCGSGFNLSNGVEVQFVP